MASSDVVEPVDITEDCGFGVTARWPALPPDQFRLDRFEECLRGIAVAVVLAAH